MMTGALKSSATVIAALWVGVLFCLGFVVAPYLFILAAKHSPAVPDTGTAAALIGPLLYSSDVVGLIVGGGLLGALGLLRARGQVTLGGRYFLAELGVLVAVGCAAVNYWVMTPRINAVQRMLRAQADAAGTLAARFQDLHQASTTIFTVGFAAALVVLVCMTQFRPKPVRSTG